MDASEFLAGLIDSIPSTLLGVVEAKRQAMGPLDAPSTVLEVARAIDAVEAAAVELRAARVACSDLLVEQDRVRIAAMRGSLTQYAQSTRGVGTFGDGGRAAILAYLRAEESVERVDQLSTQLRTKIALVERLVARLPPADPPQATPAAPAAPAAQASDVTASDLVEPE